MHAVVGVWFLINLLLKCIYRWCFPSVTYKVLCWYFILLSSTAVHWSFYQHVVVQRRVRFWSLFLLFIELIFSFDYHRCINLLLLNYFLSTCGQLKFQMQIFFFQVATFFCILLNMHSRFTANHICKISWSELWSYFLA